VWWKDSCGDTVKLHNIIAIAVALAMDAFAVAIATGIRLKIVNIRQTFRLSWHFGFFQALMPIVGWYTGLTVRPFIEQYDHWVAFALLISVTPLGPKTAIKLHSVLPKMAFFYISNLQSRLQRG